MSTDKLYPPKIDNILPAFTLTDVGSGKFLIKVPYYLNPMIGYEDFSKVSYVIKSVSSNTEIASGTISKSSNSVFNAEKQCYDLNIKLDRTTYRTDFLVGQHYKIQIAFTYVVDGVNKIGYYSNAGIAKCVVTPQTMTVTQSNLQEVIGSFKDSVSHEKVYSYSFELYDNNNVLVESSGVQLHNNANDTSANMSQDKWRIQTSLESDMPYVIKYRVTTINNYTPPPATVNLVYYETIPPRIEEAELRVENNFEEGYNRIYLYRDHPTTKKLIVRGNFYILRASHKDNYTQWDKIAEFQLYNWSYNKNKPVYEVYKDYFIEQGVNYRYAIQAYSNAKKDDVKFQIYSAKLLNKEGPIYSDFEDIFLYDGERQLKIRFNPKISSFKPVLLESKTDTIGSKYPYFFRNGDVSYKEFNLSGLISMVSNNNNEFLIDEKKYVTPPELTHVNTELSSYNYQKEREFKLEVLNWLTNGKEKILKAPAEGNYIVRLINTTLTPNDTLGRMLHTFSSMAYEIATYDIVNLEKLGFLERANQIPRFYRTKNLSKALQDEYENNGNLNIPFSANLIVDEVVVYTTPELEVQYRVNGDSSTTIRTKKADIYGVANLSEDPDLKEKGLRYLLNTSWDVTDSISYSYLNKVKKITGWYWAYSVSKGTLTFSETGPGTDISMKNYLNEKNTTTTTSSGVTTVVKNAISSFPYVAITKKQIVNIYKKSNKYYSNSGCTTQINKSFVESHQGKIFKIKDTDTYVLVTINGNTLSYKEILGESGVFYIITETDSQEKLTYLGDLESNNKKVYRDLYDFKLGQGLVVNGSSPKKVITAKNNSDYSYAI